MDEYVKTDAVEVDENGRALLIHTMYKYVIDVLSRHSQMNGTELNVAAEICHMLLDEPRT